MIVRRRSQRTRVGGVKNGEARRSVKAPSLAVPGRRRGDFLRFRHDLQESRVDDRRGVS
jgi:hypothetical protein